jgi:RES domain-containing protein
LRYKGVCYRAHDPKWSFSPISGAGAAIRGQRFNPKGVETLYLALTVEGAFLEATQGFSMKFVPYTMCSYDLDCDDIADLRTPDGRALHEVNLDDMSCAWMNFLLAGKDPPSWSVARCLISEGFAGMLVPSFAPGATADKANMVLWDWSDKAPHQAVVFDPKGQLPKDQSSWS